MWLICRNKKVYVSWEDLILYIEKLQYYYDSPREGSYRCYFNWACVRIVLKYCAATSIVFAEVYGIDNAASLSFGLCIGRTTVVTRWVLPKMYIGYMMYIIVYTI